MRARKLLDSFLVCLPGIVLGSIGLEARMRPVEYQWPETSEVQAERIAAYGSIVRDTLAALQHRSSSITVCEDLADRWIEGTQNGRLQPVYASTSEDGIRAGLKGEAFAARRQLAIRLRIGALRMAPADPDRAAQNLVRSLRLCESVKYCDFDAVSITTEEQTAAVEGLREILPRTSVESRRSLARQAAELSKSLPSLDSLVRLILRQAPIDSRTSARALQMARKGQGSAPQTELTSQFDSLIANCRSMPAIRSLRLMQAGIESQERLRTELVLAASEQGIGTGPVATLP